LPVIFSELAKRLANFYKTRYSFIFLLIFLILITYMLLEIKNHWFWLSDFKVYDTAATKILAGENLYRGDIDGFYKYKYSPVSALYFIPFALLPFPAAKVAYRILLSFLVCVGFYLAISLAQSDFKDEAGSTNTIILLAALVLGVHIERELHLGQVNHLLLVEYLGIAFLWQRGKTTLSALIWADSIYIKPFGLIFLPYFIIKRQLKMVITFLIFTSTFACMPIPICGFSGALIQYKGWFSEIIEELSHKQGPLQE
jgi:hypothetical protein